MPIRTSAVVAVGITLLTLLGVATIFGNSIVAMVAPLAVPVRSYETARDAGQMTSPDSNP